MAFLLQLFPPRPLYPCVKTYTHTHYRHISNALLQNNLAQVCLHTGPHTVPHTEEMLKSPNNSIPFTVLLNLECVTDTVLGAADNRELNETRHGPAKVHSGKGDRRGHKEF